MLDVARNMVDYDLEIRIITNKSNGVIRDFIIDGISVKVLQQNTLRFPTSEVISAILNEKTDVIYWFGNAVSGLYLRLYQNLEIPFILHISQSPLSIKELLRLRSRKIWDYRYDLLSIIAPMNFIYRFLNCKPIKTIIVPSKAIGKRLISLGVLPDKVKPAPLAFYPRDETSRSIPEAKGLLGLDTNKFIMTYFGGSDTIRGTDIVIQAALSLKNKGISDFLMMMLIRRETKFADKDELYLRRFIKRHNLDDSIQIVSKILSREILARYLYASDLIVLPFKIVPSEPPLGVLEALSLGRTVVITDVGGLPELVTNDRGVIVKPANVGDLGKVVLQLMRSEMRAKLGCQAKKYTSELSSFGSLAKWTQLQLFKAVSS